MKERKRWTEWKNKVFSGNGENSWIRMEDTNKFQGQTLLTIYKYRRRVCLMQTALNSFLKRFSEIILREHDELLCMANWTEGFTLVEQKEVDGIFHFRKY